MAASLGLYLWRKAPSIFWKFLSPGEGSTLGLVKNGKSAIYSRLLLWNLRSSVARDRARRLNNVEVTACLASMPSMASNETQSRHFISATRGSTVHPSILGGKDSQLRIARNYSDGDGGQDPSKNNKKPLKLMDFKEIIWPHPLKSLRNFWFSLLIRGYYDNSYNPETFLKGAEQAITTVSNLMSEGRFDDLESLLSRDAIREIRKNYNELSTKQRQFIKVDASDIFFRFIYEIGMIFDDNSNQRFVEITAVFQGIHGMNRMQHQDSQDFAEQMRKSEDQVYVCNYRFIREFTKGVEDSWTINKLNHFSPKELVMNTGIFQR